MSLVSNYSSKGLASQSRSSLFQQEFPDFFVQHNILIHFQTQSRVISYSTMEQLKNSISLAVKEVSDYILLSTNTFTKCIIQSQNIDSNDAGLSIGIRYDQESTEDKTWYNHGTTIPLDHNQNHMQSMLLSQCFPHFQQLI